MLNNIADYLGQCGQQNITLVFIRPEQVVRFWLHRKPKAGFWRNVRKGGEIFRGATIMIASYEVDKG